MEEFSSWTANKLADLKHFLTPDIKCEAFSLATQQRNLSLTRMVFSVYQFMDDKELFVKPIRELVSRQQYKEVSPERILWQFFTCESLNFNYCVAFIVLSISVVLHKVVILIDIEILCKN
jgi:hypothetical protein